MEVNKGIILAVGNYPDGGATSMRLKYLASALREGGIHAEISIIHATIKDKIADSWDACGVDNDIPFKYLNGRTRRPVKILPVIWDTIKGIMGAARLVSVQKSNDAFLIFYTPKLFKCIVPLLIAKMRGVPVFFEACELWSISSNNNSGLMKKLANSGDLILEWLIPRCSLGIITISTQIRNHYLKLGARIEQVYLLPILVDMEEYAAESKTSVAQLENKRFFLNSGSFAEKDGTDYLIRAFEAVADECSDVYLVFTGNVSASSREVAVSCVKNAEVAHRILFTGLLSRDELVWCYQNALALLSCRSNSLYANYGLSTKLAEYLSTGTPVIATRVGDTEKYLVDGVNSLLADPENVPDISGCMKKVLSAPEEAKVLGLKGQGLAAEAFHYKQHGGAMVRFIRNQLN